MNNNNSKKENIRSDENLQFFEDIQKISNEHDQKEFEKKLRLYKLIVDYQHNEYQQQQLEQSRLQTVKEIDRKFNISQINKEYKFPRRNQYDAFQEINSSSSDISLEFINSDKYNLNSQIQKKNYIEPENKKQSQNQLQQISPQPKQQQVQQQQQNNVQPKLIKETQSSKEKNYYYLDNFTSEENLSQKQVELNNQDKLFTSQTHFDQPINSGISMQLQQKQLLGVHHRAIQQIVKQQQLVGPILQQNKSNVSPQHKIISTIPGNISTNNLINQSTTPQSKQLNSIQAKLLVNISGSAYNNKTRKLKVPSNINCSTNGIVNMQFPLDQSVSTANTNQISVQQQQQQSIQDAKKNTSSQNLRKQRQKINNCKEQNQNLIKSLNIFDNRETILQSQVIHDKVIQEKNANLSNMKEYLMNKTNYQSTKSIDNNNINNNSNSNNNANKNKWIDLKKTPLIAKVFQERMALENQLLQEQSSQQNINKSKNMTEDTSKMQTKTMKKHESEQKIVTCKSFELREKFNKIANISTSNMLKFSNMLFQKSKDSILNSKDKIQQQQLQSNSSQQNSNTIINNESMNDQISNQKKQLQLRSNNFTSNNNEQMNGKTIVNNFLNAIITNQSNATSKEKNGIQKKNETSRDKQSKANQPKENSNQNAIIQKIIQKNQNEILKKNQQLQQQKVLKNNINQNK